MMKFGNSEHFAIWVDYNCIGRENSSEFQKAVSLCPDNNFWGVMYFWVNGKNIFAYDDPDPKATYTYILIHVFEFFCSYMKDHIRDDPFPVKTESLNASEMNDETSLVALPDNDIAKILDIDWDNVDMKLREQIDLWKFHHWILPHSGGSFLPNVFFRKLEANIEVSWKNEEPFESRQGEFFLKYRKGVEYIDINQYVKVISEFCNDFIERFSHVYPELIAENKQALDDALKKFNELESNY